MSLREQLHANRSPRSHSSRRVSRYTSVRCDCLRTGSSHSIPSHSKSSKICASYSGLQRGWSISSILRTNVPLFCLQLFQIVSAEYAWPRCKRPVGEGAKRSRIGCDILCPVLREPILPIRFGAIGVGCIPLRAVARHFQHSLRHR